MEYLPYLPYVIVSLYSVVLVTGGIWYGARLSARLWTRDERMVMGKSAEIPERAGNYAEDIDNSSG